MIGITVFPSSFGLGGTGSGGGTVNHSDLTNRTDVNSHPAEAIGYNNIYTGLNSINVQDAILEMSGGLSKECGEDIVQYNIVVIIDNKVYKADKDNLNHLKLPKYIAMTSKFATEIVTIREEGLITNNLWSLSPNISQFLGNNGNITEIVPTTGFVQKIGVAINANILDLEIGQPIKL